ncbi:peptidoglycan DD-metalloendopeptidase family protein [Bacillus mangrovi]|uniref:Peptidoglycan DD-metalloendopeptidase family protein n=1 Tax=Metabacillus mangrovi TaxID=1491830 RepID=A0A7X2S7F2_9BACI|nr:M23 family metallopeptidase [Metabacillus mangrovi]MTH55022.1 peptidoglycan DD-metalloendopeptidase family protein [Metabacillus mangrovi]
MKKWMLVVLFLALGIGFQHTVAKEEAVVRPKAIGKLILKGEYERVYRQTSEEFRKEISLEDFMELSNKFNIGVKKYKLVSDLPLAPEIKEYIWLDQTGTKGISAAVEKDGTIAGLGFVLLEKFASDRFFTKYQYEMPFKGRWFTYWGGTNVLQNYHYEFDIQRYAYDFVKMKRGMTYKGDPLKNESYFAFGKPVLAPLGGTVVETENGVRDNIPGEMNEDEPLGNTVIIQHANGEYSVLAHFKQGSVKVKKGDKVRTGQLLGECGNSGNSSEAHIHFQVSSSPEVFEGKSIRIQFKNGKEPVRGETVRN